MPLADAKLSGQRDAFKKGFQIIYFLSLLKRDDIIWNPVRQKMALVATFFNAPGPLIKFKSSHQSTCAEGEL